MSSNKGSGDGGAPHKDERKRFIYQVWDRNPHGPILKRGQAPDGARTPNGQVWGHSLSDFFWIERIPGVNVRTIWSTSMLQRLNDRLFPSQKKILAAYQHPFPRILQPWPLLCAPNEKGELETLFYGGDDGCELGHDLMLMCTRLREVGDHIESGPTRIRDLAPAQKKAFLSAARRRLKQTLTTGMDPTAVKNDPRWAIPDQSAPSNERLPPKLEEFIPKEYLPDVLLVHDPQGVTAGEERRPSDGDIRFEAGVPIRYKRMYPEPMTDGHTSNVAHLYLSASNVCGRGNHSFVYYAPLTLPEPLTARTPTRQVTVLAKMSFPESEHQELLSQEGLIYGTFPEWMMEDYCGYNVVDQIPYPVPACAIVPKFYGFYVPEDDDCDYLSPILLLEDCGLPVRLSTLHADDRAQLHAMFVNLHKAGFLQGSVYARNIVIQPGPLTVPPSKRSLASPSFRIIDFGRAEYKLYHIRNAIGADASERHKRWLNLYDDFINTVGAAEAEKEYTVTVYDDEDGEGENKKGREVAMVMGLEKAEWEKLCKAWCNWTELVMEADSRVQVTLGAGYHDSTSQRVPITTVSLKDRIAALGLQDRTTAQSTPLSQSTTPLSTTASGFVSTSPSSSTSARVRDKAAQFEAIGGTPVPRGSFGLGAPPIFSKLKKTGELYGNRIPGSQPPPLGRQWPPGSPGSAYGSDIEGASPGLRSVSMPLRTNSLTGSDDGITADERTAVEVNMSGMADGSTAPIARIQVVPPSPAFPPPETSRRRSVDVSVPDPIVEEPIKPPPSVNPPPVPEVPEPPPQPASDPGFDSNFTRSPSIHSHVSSPLASVEEEPVALDEDDARAPEQPTLTYTPEQLHQSITPLAASPKKKTKLTASPKASLSPPLTSPPLRPLRRSSSARGRDRNLSIDSTNGDNGSVFTAPPVQGDDIGGGIHLSSTMETVEQDGLGLSLHADENGSGSEEEGVRRDEVPQGVEATGDVVGKFSIRESLERSMTELVEESKRDDASIIEEPALKEQDDHSQGCERSNSSGTTDYTMGDAPSFATSPDIESITLPQLADDSEADVGKLDETMHQDVLPIPDVPQAAVQDLDTERSSACSPSDDVGFTPREAVEPTKVPEINQPVQEKEDPSQGSAPSKPDAEDTEPVTSPTSPDSSSSFSLTFKDSISRAGLIDAGTASRARVLRELKQLGMEKRSSVVLSPTRRTSVLSVVLPTSPERLKFFSNSEKSPEQSAESPLTSTSAEIRPTDTPTSDKTSIPVIASPSEARSPISFGVALSSVSPISESGKGVDETSQPLPPTPPSGSIAFPTPSTSASTSTSTGLSSRQSTDDLSYAPSFDSRISSTSSMRHYTLYGAPTMPPPSGPLPPIPLSPPPPTPPPKDVPGSFGKAPPPKSFRELYSAGRLPPASRGPGMHQSAQGRPLLGRATSLSDRPLPALPNSNYPRRTTSAFVNGSSDRMRTTSMHVSSLQTVPASPQSPPPENPFAGQEKAYPTLVPYNRRLRTVSSPLSPRAYPFNASLLDMKPRAQENTNHSRGSSLSSNQSSRTSRYQPLPTNPVPSSYRPPSPTPSNYSDSHSGTVCSILSPNFDRRIFDAFPDVPRQLPDPTVLTRQGSLGVSEPSGSEPRPRTPAIAVTIAPPDDQEDAGVMQGRELRTVITSTRAGASKPRPVSMAYGEGASEMGQWAKQVSPVRERKKSTTRPLIPTWYDDDDYDENEAGWASVSVVRRQIA